MRSLKTAVILAICALVLTVTSAVVGAQELGYGVVTAQSGLNVRTGPSTENAVIAKLPWGTVVDVLAWDSNNWYQIKLSDGAEGFVSCDYLSLRTTAQVSRDGSTVDRTRTSKGQEIVNNAAKYLGIYYKYGGTSPKTGFDCSGFTQYVLNESGISVNRTSRDQFKQGTRVDKANLQPGDLLFFSTRKDKTITHTGIYVGNGKMIHSPETGKAVSYVTINEGHYLRTYVGAKRMY